MKKAAMAGTLSFVLLFAMLIGMIMIIAADEDECIGFLKIFGRPIG